LRGSPFSLHLWWISFLHHFNVFQFCIGSIMGFPLFLPTMRLLIIALSRSPSFFSSIVFAFRVFSSLSKRPPFFVPHSGKMLCYFLVVLSWHLTFSPRFAFLSLFKIGVFAFLEDLVLGSSPSCFSLSNTEPTFLNPDIGISP